MCQLVCKTLLTYSVVPHVTEADNTAQISHYLSLSAATHASTQNDRYPNNFVADNVVEGEVNLCNSVDVDKPPDHREHQRHQWQDSLDLVAQTSRQYNND